MKNRINILFASGLLATAALLASTAASDTTSPASKQTTVPTVRRLKPDEPTNARTPRANRYPIRGKLRSVDPTAKTFTLAGTAKDRVFVIDDLTVITKNGKPAQLTDGVPGDEVGGLAENLPNGKLLAVKVRFGPKPGNENQAAKQKPAGSRQNKASPNK